MKALVEQSSAQPPSLRMTDEAAGGSFYRRNDKESFLAFVPCHLSFREQREISAVWKKRFLAAPLLEMTAW
jgi:hypothetical protein